MHITIDYCVCFLVYLMTLYQLLTLNSVEWQNGFAWWVRNEMERSCHGIL